ncbi:MAG: hypothetical protein AAB325_00375 [Pseudomonadota bacterium]
MARKKLLEFRLKCPCGASAPVFEVGERFMAHCAGCGAITFWGNPALLERLKYSNQLCSHELERRPCKGGQTTWCPKCRVRTFYYGQDEMPQKADVRPGAAEDGQRGVPDMTATPTSDGEKPDG